MPRDIAGVCDAIWRPLCGGAVFSFDRCGVGNVLCHVQRSTDWDRLEDITREGPFDAVASPMDTDDSPLVTAGLPGCPYRITSYTRPAPSNMNPAFGLQFHHPWFLDSRRVNSSTGAAGGQVYGGDGSVVPSDGSG